jgi:hypothetical protein
MACHTISAGSMIDAIFLMSKTPVSALEQNTLPGLANKETGVLGDW